MNNNTSKSIMLSVVGVALLVVAVVGVSFAFFSYLGTGSVNNVETGQIYFNASAGTLSLTNAFPTDASGAVSSTIQVKGNTTYANGIDFTVSVVSFTDNTGGKIVPTVSVTAVDELPAGVTVSPREVTSIAAGTVLATGKVSTAANMATLSDVLTISAYIDKAKYHISNTTDASALKAAGLLDQNFNGTIILQDEWNSYVVRDGEGNVTTPAYSFTIQVTAVEGAGA